MKHFHYNLERPYTDRPDLYLAFWGKEDCEPGHSFGPGVRDLYKVHFVHSGRGTVTVHGQTYSLAAGQAFLAFPRRVIAYRADDADPWTYSWIGFFGNRADSVVSRTALTPEAPVFPMDTRIMPDLYRQLEEASRCGPSRDLRLHALLLEWLAAMVEAAPAASPAAPGGRTRDGYVHRCLEYLHTCYSEPVSVQQLAAELGLDRKYLSAVFKEATGLPPQQYLLAYRMERACELLKSGEYTVGEVARSVGYQDALLFSKMFKKLKGTSPSRYR